MKNIYLNIQSKGGAGKSMLTYFQALKNEENENSVFVDLDSSTHTSSRQLIFIHERDPNRVYKVDILDQIKKIEREKLFKIFEALNGMNFNEIYIDFGAPESEQLPRLFSIDFTLEEFKEFEASMDVKIVFNVIMAGGTAYTSTFEYLKRITEIVKGKFDVYAFVNEFTFQNYTSQIEELKGFIKSAKGVIKGMKSFGDIHIDRGSGQTIIDNIRSGRGMDGFNGFPVKIIIKRELAKI